MWPFSKRVGGKACPGRGPAPAKAERDGGVDVLWVRDVVAPEQFLMIVVTIGIVGPLPLPELLAVVRGKGADAVAVWSGSIPPSDSVVEARALKFLADPTLVLVSGRYPRGHIEVVRRTFLLEQAPGLRAATLEDLAAQLADAASKRGLKVSYV